MSKHQDNDPSYDPTMPWLTRPGGIQLSDWPSDIVTPEMIAKEAKWAKAGEKYDFQGPIRGDHYNRYVKETKNGPVYKNPPQIHRASEHYMLPPNRARAKAADQPSKEQPKIEAARKRHGNVPVELDDFWHEVALDMNPQITGIPPQDRAALNAELQDFQRGNGVKSVRGLPKPIREKEQTLEQTATQLKKVFEKTTVERSSTRLQQKAQAALELAQRNTVQQSAKQLMPSPPALLLVRESAIRSTLQDPQTSPGFAQATPHSPPTERESASSANVASADIETESAKNVASSKYKPVNTQNSVVINKNSGVFAKAASPTKSPVAPKAATSTKTKPGTKPTMASKTMATTKTETVTKLMVDKKATVAPKPESCPRAIEAIRKTSGPTKVSGSSATSNGSKTASKGVSGKKRTAVDTTTVAPVKRPRISRACDACRDKKTRCDGKRACDACTKRRSDCVYGDGQPQPKKSTQNLENGTIGDDGHSGKLHQIKRHPSSSKGNPTTSSASATSDSVKENKRKQEDEDTNTAAQPCPSKKTKMGNTILRSPAAQAAQLRAHQQLDGDIQRFMQERSPISDAVSPKRKRTSSDEDAETQPAKLQRPTHYTFEVLEIAGLETMQKDILDFLAQSASDFKPLQKIGHLVRGGKLRPQIINISLQEEAFHNRPSIKLVLPDHIKGFLVDDWENVTKNNQLVHLPHPKPVEVILQDYLAAEKPNREEGSTQMDILEETIAGLREYFDRALGRILLYRFERAQYADQQSKWSGENNKEGPSTTYGAEHLSRLLVSLPELIAQTNMDQQSVGRLREEITKFTNWLGKNYATYWQKEYETPDAEYLASAKSG